MSHPSFDYNRAFSRNLGFITEEEREIIKTKRIAIAGLGGVGGTHLITLLRMGFQKFNLAEFDQFELHNFNRQYGANMTTLNRNKLDVMIEKALELNPNADIMSFPNGVNHENIDAFLSDVDMYIDGLDLFVLDVRQKIFRFCNEKKIPASTVAPIGMGGALINFLSHGMSFDDYFGFTEDQYQNCIKMLAGLSPKSPHSKSLVDIRFLNFKKQQTSSTPMGVALASGIIATEVLKIMLKRGPISCAPTSIHFDAYTNKTYRHTTWFGSRNPFFKLRVRAINRMIDNIPS